MICDKTSYDTEDLARRALKQITKNNQKFNTRRTKTPKRYYRCTRCDKWHLTAKSLKEYKRGFDKQPTPEQSIEPIDISEIQKRKAELEQKLILKK